MEFNTESFLLYICISPGIAQKLHKTIMCDTAIGYASYRAEIRQLQLPDLLYSTDSIHFRYSTDNRAVDIWSQNGVTYYGTAKTFTYKVYNKRGKRVTPEIFSNNMQLDTAVAKRAYNLIQSNIVAIFTNNPKKHLLICDDCTIYNFEIASLSKYCFMSFDAVIDSTDLKLKMVEQLADTIDSLLLLNKLHEDLFKQVPRGCAYTYAGPTVVTIPRVRYVLFKRKPDMCKRYLDSIADTLNTYLSDTLTKLLWKYGELACGGDLFLKFSRNNELLKIIPSAKLSEVEKKDFQDCQQKIMEAIKSVRLDFVHSSIDYRKRFSYFQGTVRIFD